MSDGGPPGPPVPAPLWNDYCQFTSNSLLLASLHLVVQSPSATASSRNVPNDCQHQQCGYGRAAKTERVKGTGTEVKECKQLNICLSYFYFI